MESFHPIQEVFFYNLIVLITLRSRSNANATMVLTRADYLFIHNYIRSLLNIILRHMLMVRTGLYIITACVAQLAKASNTQAVGQGLEPRPEHYNRSYNNI